MRKVIMMHILTICLSILITVCVIYGFYAIFKEGKMGVGAISFILAVLIFFFQLTYNDSPLPKTNSTTENNEVETGNTENADHTNNTDNTADIEALRTQILNDAKNGFAANGYKEAIRILSEGLQTLPDDEIIMEEISNYKEYQPVNLVDMDWISNTATGVEDYTDKNQYSEDSYGNTYNTSFSLSSGSVIYNLNYKFKQFQCTIACPAGIQYSSFRDSAEVTIYGDDELLYKSPKINNETKPIPISLDTSGVEILKISWESNGGNVWLNWGYFATLFDAILIK